MNLFTTLLAFFHCSDFRNSRFVKWLVGDEEPKPGSCACKGTWDKYKETEHGPKYCSRSTYKSAFEA